MRSTPARRRPVTALAVLATLFGSEVSSAQMIEFEEAVEVRVANIDVVVTSDAGLAVAGLAREDFRLFVNGEPRAIEYFAAVNEGLAVGGDELVSAAPLATRDGAGLAAMDRPLLALVYDARSLRPGEALRALEQLTELLPRLVDTTAAVMIVRQGASLVVEQPFTRDLAALQAAVGRLPGRGLPNVEAGARAMLVRQIESREQPVIEGEGSASLLLEEQARALLHQVRSQVEVERYEAEKTTRQLRSLVAALAPLRGRKAVLLIGAGLQTRPGEVLFRLWWERFGAIATSLGIGSLQAEIGIDRYTDHLTDLVDQASAGRVAFYSFDPGGPRVTGVSLEFDTMEAAALLGRDDIDRQEALLALGRATGGLGQIHDSDLEKFLSEMTKGFQTYYSLGFTPLAEDRLHGRIRVELGPPGLKARYVDRYIARPPYPGLEERVLTTLLTDLSQNPLDVRVELETPEKQDDGTYMLPMFVKVPIARLALLPDAEQHRGKLSVVVMAQDAEGDLSPPARGEVPIDIDNSEMVSAVAGLAGYRLRVRMGAGPQRLAVGVRDEIGRADTVVNLVLDPEHGS